MASLSTTTSTSSTSRAAFATVTNAADAHLSGANAAYVEDTYKRWVADPTSVHSSWDSYFRLGSFVAPPSLTGSSSVTVSTPIAPTAVAAVTASAAGGVDPKVLGVLNLIRAYQQQGHLIADLDPLGLTKDRLGGVATHPELTPEYHGLTEADLDKTFSIDLFPKVKGFLAQGATGPQTLRTILEKVKAAYSGHIGYELNHLDSQEELNWFRERIELDKPREIPGDEQVRVLRRLVQANRFETFIGVKFNTKRFGVEGAESSIAGLREIVRRSTELGVDTCIMGMAHRGRLNVLANIVKKPLEVIFAEFQGYSDAGPALTKEEGAFHLERDESIGAGDVKYHQGWSSTHVIDNGKSIHITMLPNPSHLEAVNPLVMGKAKAKQFFSEDTKGDRIMSVLIHGDASFSGQGVVFESMAMHGLPDYNVGGTIHMVINNQIGFTTDPFNSRSGPYCSDVAKAFRAPILHVNGDDADAVVQACSLAAEFRAKFKRDVVVDVVCYRLNGHNEMDNPFFTQPKMYEKVKTMYNKAGVANSVQQYEAKLLREGRVTAERIAEINEEVNNMFKDAFEKSKVLMEEQKNAHEAPQEHKQFAGPNKGQYCTAQWQGLKDMSAPISDVQPTAAPLSMLKDLGLQLSTVPAEFQLQKAIADAYKAKKTSIETGKNIDWATGEALAFATLLAEGIPVRIAGQDVQRGTFSHRHAVVHCQATGKSYTPLHHLAPNPSEAAGVALAPTPARFTPVNSLLSEFAAMGFELGYSMDHPNQLVLWEAQFGDFVNGAQIILDNFLSSGEHKWSKQSGLTLLLPHGYEGQGAEHSSARMERFLQSANDDPNDMPEGNEQSTFRLQRANWQIVNITTPANYYHALRRQIKRSFRKPLIVFSPKVCANDLFLFPFSFSSPFFL